MSTDPLKRDSLASLLRYVLAWEAMFGRATVAVAEAGSGCILLTVVVTVAVVYFRRL
jgi:uncharacterized MnhB-related membrane protein